MGLSTETEFGLSLNGSDLLEDTGQALASCGLVSGDLIRVVLLEPAAAAADARNPAADPRGQAEGVAMETSRVSPTEPSPDVGQKLVSGGGSVPLASSSSPGPDPPGWEPMLCSEADAGQAPLSLELLYHAAQVGGAADAVVVAAHLLMLETGFTSQVRR